MQLERDSDMAAEMAQFTRDQIMSQASIFMLAQANQSTMAVLKLLGWDNLIHFCKKRFSILESLFTEKEGYISKEKYPFYFINTEAVKLSSTLSRWVGFA